MAPIPRLAGKPLSIVIGALFTAFSSPSSSPPTDGLNATVWGTEYSGSASYFDLSLFKSSSPTSSSSTDSSSSLVYYSTKTNTYTGCDKKTFSPTDNIALMNPLQFGDISSDNSTCGEWIKIQNRKNTMQSTYAKIVGVCDDCKYGSIDLSIGALSELAPDVPFDQFTFSSNANDTITDLLGIDSPLPIGTTPVSPEGLLSIAWSLSEATSTASSTGKPTATATSTTSTSTSAPSPTPTSAPSHFSGRATWYSDTTGKCEHSYSQSDMIVAVNQAQMGDDKSICGKKILLTQKGSTVQVVVTIVDMCPSKYCKFGDLDLSQAAFKEFADLDVGVLDLEWNFI
ncbi:hypothetical protein BGX27_003794 [Mortierella sp. AM989]|nr:hypothetical protein BGX27_003794 [Mortierella sp. AM989]